MYRKFLLWLTQTKFWAWLLLKVLPYIRFSMYYTRLRGKQYHAGYRLLKPADFILTVDEQKLTTFLVPGLMTHAAFCVAKKSDRPCDFEVAEMTHENYTKSDFFDLCKEASRVLICTCNDWTDVNKVNMIQTCYSFEDALYDVSMNLKNALLGIKHLYCSALVWWVDQENGHKMECDLTDLEGLGQEYISPDGLLFAKNTRVVWDSDGELDGMIGPEAEKFCRAKGYIK
jgi:hypothetical protein